MACSAQETPAGSDAAHGRVPVVHQDRCVACGKCVRIAPRGFKLDTTTEKAKVVDPHGAAASVIQKAINRCPSDALRWSQ